LNNEYEKIIIMPIMLNSILLNAGLQLKDVRIIRHKDQRAKKGCSPYELWRDNPAQFESYQSTQSIANRQKLTAPFWAVFVVNFSNKTLFAGLYSAEYRGLIEQDTPMPHMDDIDKAESCDVYNLKLQTTLSDFIGRLFIDWGPGALAWVQYAERNNKPITELHREFQEPDFPGFMKFNESLSKLNNMPLSWISVLKSTNGVYLLTCPKTKELYVGSASGFDGFWGRWQDYIQTGHGGNLGLKSREPSDYQVSILEVAGTSASKEDILTMEGRWQTKLQSREMGLNRNLAGTS
jgi:hypothetical protein